MRQYILSGNLDGLRELFSSGQARPTDILAPWGHSLRHEAVFNFASGRFNALEVCQFLLEQGADLNTRSMKGSTPLVLCCRLMSESTQKTKLPLIANLLIDAETDLTVCDSEGYSACSLIFKSQHGLQYLENFVYRYIDLFTLQQMASVDAWVFATVTRSFLTFQIRPEAQLREYYTCPNLSSARFKKDQSIVQFDIRHQVTEIQTASVEVRTSFMKSLCAKGTVVMIEPFLRSGIDLNETDTDSTMTYIHFAAKNGNIDVVLALLSAGALINI